MSGNMKRGTVPEERTATSSAIGSSSCRKVRSILNPYQQRCKRLANATFSASAWDTYRRLKAGWEHAEEERDLRYRIVELKEDANKIAITISLMQIVLPIPECVEA